MQGKVTFFDQTKGFGFISADQNPKIFVHIRDLNGLSLMGGEEVSFDLIQTDKGFQAKNIALLNSGSFHTGSVKEFANGFGQIAVDNSTDTVFIHHSNILGAGFKHLRIGEPVRFEITEESGRKIAKQISRLDPRSPWDRFARTVNFDDLLNKLATGLAQSENWNYVNSKFVQQKSFPILRRYLTYTFERLEDEKKIVDANDANSSPIACYNTGLVTEFQEEIFAYFVQNRQPSGSTNPKILPPPWFLKDFCTKSDRRLSFFSNLPDIAKYFDSSSQLVFDATKRLIVDYDHILSDNISRFPVDSSAGNREYKARLLLEGALDLAKKRVRRNYKTAVPQFHRGKLQLLLPLCLQTPKDADLALVVEENGDQYRASTVLTLDMAYSNARLLARPDREWLDP